jgi:hypothetical protein
LDRKLGGSQSHSGRGGEEKNSQNEKRNTDGCVRERDFDICAKKDQLFEHQFMEQRSMRLYDDLIIKIQAQTRGKKMASKWNLNAELKYHTSSRWKNERVKDTTVILNGMRENGWM